MCISFHNILGYVLGHILRLRPILLEVSQDSLLAWNFRRKLCSAASVRGDARILLQTFLLGFAWKCGEMFGLRENEIISWKYFQSYFTPLGWSWGMLTYRTSWSFQVREWEENASSRKPKTNQRNQKLPLLVVVYRKIFLETATLWNWAKGCKKKAIIRCLCTERWVKEGVVEHTEQMSFSALTETWAFRTKRQLIFHSFSLQIWTASEWWEKAGGALLPIWEKKIICSYFEICHSIHGAALLSLLLCSIFLLLIDFIFLFPSMILAWQ